MSVKLLTEHHLEFLSLNGGCTGSFESTLVKMSICWRSHATAHIWAPTWENMSSEVCEQQRLRQACASARCIGSSESTLVKMSICWRSHATAHIWAPDARKPVFGGLRTTKAQTSLRIRAVWSAPLLFAFWKVPYLSLLQAKFQVSS